MTATEPFAIGCTGGPDPAGPDGRRHVWIELDHPPVAVRVGPCESWSLASKGEPYAPGRCSACGRDERFGLESGRAAKLQRAIIALAAYGVTRLDVTTLPF